MTALSISNPADRRSLDLLATKYIAANQTAEEKAERQELQNSDALYREKFNRKCGCEPITPEAIADTVPAHDNESTVDELTAALLAEDGAVAADEDQLDESELLPLERKAEASRRAADRKAQAHLADDQLSSHRLAELEATLRIAVPAVLRNPGSAKEYAWALAFRHEADKLIGRSKFAERVADEQGESESTVKRQVREGKSLWASLLQVALGLKVDPDEAIPYLATLSRSTQLRVAQVAEQHRGEWEVGEEVDRHKRAKKLSHGILNKLPAPQLCDEATRLRLSAMTEQAQMKEVAAMRNAEKAKLQKANDLNNRRDAKFANLSTEAGSLLVKMFASATATDRDHFLTVMGLAPVANAVTHHDTPNGESQ
jgi:hypothetical protein